MLFQAFVVLLVCVSFSSSLTVVSPSKPRNLLRQRNLNDWDWYGPSFFPPGWNLRKFQRSGHDEFHFGYDPPNDDSVWPQHFEECGGDRQSPINIKSADLTVRNSNNPLRWRNYDVQPVKLELQNSGHSIHLTGTWEEGDEPFISGGPLDGEYVFSQLHFHWGRDNTKGSEHTINGKRFPLEMHVVHAIRQNGEANVDNNDLLEVNTDQIAVVGIMFELTRRPNPNFTEILDAVSSVPAADSQVNINPFPLRQLNLENIGDFVTYEGSLTTPPCSENVKWLVSSRPIGISESQLNILRTAIRLPNGEFLQNFRHIQDIHERPTVYLAF